jgi:hypothetical protein
MAESLRQADDGAEDDAAYQAISARAEGTNINPQTLLATDYLNHFNEIVMMLDMIPDIPECLEDAQAWQPKSYQDHFRDSQFRDKDLAVEAYDFVPTLYRQPFDDVVLRMNQLVAAALEKIATLMGPGQEGELRLLCGDCSRALQKMIDIAGAIIHGSVRRLDQAEIDGFLAL